MSLAHRAPGALEPGALSLAPDPSPCVGPPDHLGDSVTFLGETYFCNNNNNNKFSRKCPNIFYWPRASPDSSLFGLERPQIHRIKAHNPAPLGALALALALDAVSHLTGYRWQALPPIPGSSRFPLLPQVPGGPQ